MYWEMNIHDGKKELDAINQFFLDFFRFAAGSPGMAFDEREFEAYFPDRKQTRWFLQRLDNHAKNSLEFRRSVERLFEHSPAERGSIAEALEHDLQFDRTPAAPFRFEIPQMQEAVQKIIHDFYLYFYKQCFLKSGFSWNRYNRDRLVEDFCAKNGQLFSSCPVCLHRFTNMKRECDVEHYFLKEKYPFLSMHPGNLYLSCKNCNVVYKRCKDILSGGDRRQVYLPYKEHAKAVSELLVARDMGEDRLYLQEKPPRSAYGREKLENLDRMFELVQRWSQDMSSCYGRMKMQYRARVLSGMSEEELEQRLLEELGTEKWELPDKYVEGVYQRWIATEQLEKFYMEMQLGVKETPSDIKNLPVSVDI